MSKIAFSRVWETLKIEDVVQIPPHRGWGTIGIIKDIIDEKLVIKDIRKFVRFNAETNEYFFKKIKDKKINSRDVYLCKIDSHTFLNKGTLLEL